MAEVTDLDTTDVQAVERPDDAPASLKDRFVALYRENYRLILTTIEHRVSHRETAEDLAEKVFAIAWNKFPDNTRIDLPWLYQTARNVVGNEYQRRRREPELRQRLVDELGDLPSGDEDADPTNADLDARVEVRKRLRLLPEGERELIFMMYWEDLTGDEIAGILGCSPAAARKRMQRARTSARRVLADLIPQTEEADG